MRQERGQRVAVEARIVHAADADPGAGLNERVNERVSEPSAGRPRGTSARLTAPLYQLITRQLTEEIRTGLLPVGGLLPPEIELCKRFGASRYTVREALRAITERGLLVRRPGAGSVVIASETPTAFTQSVRSVEELMNYPPDTFRENVSNRVVVADKALAQLLNCETGMRWFRISAIRRTNSSPDPLGWTDIYLLPKYARVVDSVDHAHTHVYQQVERLFGEPTVRARFEMFASRIPTRLARPLKVASGTPALTFVRRYYGPSGDNFENSVTVHPEHRFTYSMEVQREPVRS